MAVGGSESFLLHVTQNKQTHHSFLRGSSCTKAILHVPFCILLLILPNCFVSGRFFTHRQPELVEDCETDGLPVVWNNDKGKILNG